MRLSWLPPTLLDLGEFVGKNNVHRSISFALHLEEQQQYSLLEIEVG